MTGLTSCEVCSSLGYGLWWCGGVLFRFACSRCDEYRLLALAVKNNLVLIDSL
jgi:hypothetical protein